jgi:hypothetical protein
MHEKIWPKLADSFNRDLASIVWFGDFKNDDICNELIIRSQEGLRVYKYNEKSKDWILKGNCDKRFNNENKFNDSRHKLHIYTNGGRTLVSFQSVNNGLIFLELDRSNYSFKFLINDLRFTSRYKLLHFGYFFGRTNPMGIFCLHPNEGVLIYFIDSTTPKLKICNHEKTTNRIRIQVENKQLNWVYGKVNFYFADVNGDQKTNILVQDQNGLSAYEFVASNDYFVPKKLFNVPVMSKKVEQTQTEKFFFARLTPVDQFYNLVTLEFDGLRVYKWNNEVKKYILIKYSSKFSEKNGWKSSFTNSILFKDYNYSGCDKMIYTGLKGFTINQLKFDSNTNNWYWDRLLDSEFNEILNEKYMIPVEIMPSKKSPTNKAVLIGNDLINKKPIFIQIKEQTIVDDSGFDEYSDNEKSEKSDSMMTESSLKFPKIEDLKHSITKSVVNFSSTLDMKSIVNSSVNVSNGNLNFMIPLIKVPNFDDASITLHYTSAANNLSTFESILGQGWSLVQEFIYAEFKSNKFAHKFLLFSSSGSFIQLVEVGKNCEEIEFKIENDKKKNFKISYNTKMNMWTIKNQEEKMTKRYGGNQNSIKWNDGWLGNRDFCGDTYSSYPFKWYLTSINNDSNKDLIEFKYSQDNMVRVETISLNDETEIRFNYEQKGLNELKKKEKMSYVDYAVKSIKFESKYQVQTLNFNYEFFDTDINTVRLLKSVSQEENKNILALEFFYEQFQMSKKISKVIFPDRGDSLNLTYEDASEKVIQSHYDYLLDKKLTSFATNEDIDTKAQLNSSYDYSIVSYTSNNKSMLTLLVSTKENKRFLVEITPFKSSSITDYNILAFEKHFLINIFENKSQDKAVYLYHFETIRKLHDGSQAEFNISDKCELFLNFKNICFGTEIIALITNKNQFFLYDWDHTETEWKIQFNETYSSKVLISINEDDVVLTYDDEHLNVIYKNNEKKWQKKEIISKKGYLYQTKTFALSFNLKGEICDSIQCSLEKNLLHFSINLILLNNLYILNDMVYSEQLIIYLDNEFNFVKEEKLINNKISLQDVTKCQEIQLYENEKIDAIIYHYKDGEKYSAGFKNQTKTFEFPVKKKTYERTYKLENQKMHISIKDHHGYDVELKENEKSFEKDFIECFLLNLEEFYVTFVCNQLFSAKKTLEFNGHSWIEKNTKTSNKIENLKTERVKINNEYELIKQEESTWQLVLNGNYIFDFKTKDITRIQNAFPSYIAYMKDLDNNVNILPFLIDGSNIRTDFVLTQAEYILPGGNPYLLAVKESNSCCVNFITNPTKSSLNENMRVIERVVTLDNENYVKRYEYNDNFLNFQFGSVIYSKFKIIPGNQSEKYGYIEYDVDLKIKYYNADGQLVKIEEPKKESENDSEKNNKIESSKRQTILYSKDGFNELVNFYNLDLAKDEADYIGFETYEAQRNWIFNTNACVRNEWPLLGTSFLRLKNKGNSISRIFKPKIKNIPYECSCWIKLLKSHNLKLEDHFSDFTLRIIETGEIFISKIVSMNQDWIFLTAVVDLSTKEGLVNVECEIKLNNFEQIDIDHIKWMPLNSRIQITSYNVDTQQTLSVLNETNCLKQIINDFSQQTFALINSNNQLLQLSFISNINKSIVSIEASSAFYATFSEYCCKKCWKIHNSDVWLRNSKGLFHNEINQTNSIAFHHNDINGSIAIYFNINLKSPSSKITLQLNSHEIIFTEIEAVVNENPLKMLSNGYYFVISEEKRIIIWKDNELIIDRKFELSITSSLFFSVYGLAHLSNVLILNNPIVKINHLNSFGQVRQMLHLENESTVIVKHIIYDELAREAVETKSTRATLKNHEEALAYRKSFVTNGSFNNTFWNTGLLEGEVAQINTIDNGLCYHKTNYSPDPLNYVESIDFADKLRVNQAVQRNYMICKHFKDLYPIEEGFVCQMSFELNGNRILKVFDKKENTVALFEHSQGFQGNLTTYEYDKNNNLVKILPPLYHAHLNVLTLNQVGLTFLQLNEKWNTEEIYKELQKKFGSFYTYDENQSLIESKKPECGREEFIYNKFGLLRFNLKYDAENKPYLLEYSNYNQWAEVSEKGFTKNPKCFNLEILKLIADSNETQLADAHAMQESTTSFSIKPKFNSKIVSSLVKNSSSEFECCENNYYSTPEKLLKKKMILRKIKENNPTIYWRMEKEYEGDQLKSITYPFFLGEKILKLNYKYNKQGLVSSVSIDNKKLADFSFSPSGNLIEESYFDDPFKLDTKTLLKRNYSYNSSGFLTSQKDCFLEENLSYFEDGYGPMQSYDTSISKIKFTPNWYERCDCRLICIDEDTIITGFQDLKTLTRNEANHLIKLLVNYKILDEDFKIVNQLTLTEALKILPFKYDELMIHRLISILNQNFPNESYGHQFSYGSHSELVNSKYFVGNHTIQPINAESFLVDKKISIEKSIIIWELLVESECIISESNEHNLKYGNVNDNHWINSGSLKVLLNDLTFPTGIIRKLIILLQEFYKNRVKPSQDEFNKIIEKWFQCDENYSDFEKSLNIEESKKLWEALEKNNFFFQSDNQKCTLFTEKFNIAIIENDFISILPEIIHVLIKHALSQIGSSSCDVRSIKTDANGNHQLFHIGCNRYQFNYTLNSNKINEIKTESKSYGFDYDSLGNVTKAEHKSIKQIVYDEVINQPVEFILNDGQKVKFAYDSKGERVYKCVYKNFKKTKEIFYFRDNNGRCLVDREVFYSENEYIEKDYFTAYIYGPKGLMSLIRNDELYHVVSDHELSVRLVIKNGEVISAFDYMPYGNLIRNYGNYEAQIRYRYTGQEWDEELQLYNYHARFYDPSIGRFYQVGFNYFFNYLCFN